MPWLILAAIGGTYEGRDIVRFDGWGMLLDWPGTETNRSARLETWSAARAVSEGEPNEATS